MSLPHIDNIGDNTLGEQNLLRSIDPRVKEVFVLAGLMANLVSPSPATPMLMAVILGVLLRRAGVTWHDLRLKLLAPGYFAVVAFLVKLFYSLGESQPLFTFWVFTATSEGLTEGVLLAGRVLGGALLVFFLAMTTPMRELVFLANWLRVPPAIVEVVVLMYRYTFLLADEGERIKDAQKVRLGYSNFGACIRSYGILAGMLVISAYDRSWSTYEAMMARGYNGELPMGQSRPLTRRDWGHLAALGLLVALVLGAGYGTEWLS